MAIERCTSTSSAQQIFAQIGAMTVAVDQAFHLQMGGASQCVTPSSKPAAAATGAGVVKGLTSATLLWWTYETAQPGQVQ